MLSIPRRSQRDSSRVIRKKYDVIFMKPSNQDLAMRSFSKAELNFFPRIESYSSNF